MRIEKYLDGIFLTMIIGAITGLFTNFNIPLVGALNKVMLLMYLLVLIRLLFIKTNVKIIRVGLIFIFSMYCLFNAILSQDISESLQTLIYMIFNVIYAFFLYSKYGKKNFIILMSNVLSVIMVFSFIICIISPNNTVYYDNNYGKEVWKGVFTHKNTLGNFSALSIIFLFIEDKKFFLKWIIMIISIINLFKSGSNTPTVALIVCFSYFFVKKMLKKDLSKPIGIFSVVLSYIYIFKHALMGLILNDFNITLSDSGRYEIYEFIVGLLKQKVFCGYGIGTSWIEGTNTYNLVYNRFGFNPNSSHNGFLDIVFGIGVVGLILYLIILIYIFWVHRENNQYDTKFMVILIYLLILSIFESTLYNFKGVYWVLQMFCLFSLGNDNNLEIKEINYDKS